MSAAKKTVRKEIELRFANKNAPHSTNDTEDSEEEENSDEDGIYDIDATRAQIQPKSSSKIIFEYKRNQLLFVEYSDRCLPFITWGFHIDRNNRIRNDKYCFCLCGCGSGQGGSLEAVTQALPQE